MIARRLISLSICLLAFLLAARWIGTAASIKESLLDGATVVLDDQDFRGMIQNILEAKSTELEITKFPIDDSEFNEVLKLDWLETLIIDKGILTDRSIERLPSFKNLRHLRLRLSPITDEGMKSISNVKSLWYLNLPHAKCSSKGVAYLQALPSLRQLRLGSSELSNGVAEQIATLHSLRSLHLIGVPIDDDGLKLIAALPNLQSLYLDDSKVTEDGWEWLFNKASHLHVHVNQNHHDRDAQSHDHLPANQSTDG